MQQTGKTKFHQPISSIEGVNQPQKLSIAFLYHPQTDPYFIIIFLDGIAMSMRLLFRTMLCTRGYNVC